ncbi:MAG: NUDIX domain-containing protein [bacterium]|jgi:8-oxo-dGTP pyrophosphatase MutT (NUDIX family)
MRKQKKLPEHIYNNQLRLSIGESGQSTPGALIIKVKDKKELEKCIRNFQDEKYSHDVMIHGYATPLLYEDIRSFFSFLLAAGGVVKNDAGEYLFIKRHGIWDLPKGKVHKNETAEAGAMREVAEETGIENLKIKVSLPSSYHIYKLNESFILKETRWFLMHTTGKGILTPQKEEDITSAEWLNREQASAALAGSYRSLEETLGYWFRD